VEDRITRKKLDRSIRRIVIVPFEDVVLLFLRTQVAVVGAGCRIMMELQVELFSQCPCSRED